jgi:hypothetical protein
MAATTTKVTLELTREELDLLIEALDSHAYWQIGDSHNRRDGYFREDLCDPEEDAEADAKGAR